jgi:PAS domain-containing protein
LAREQAARRQAEASELLYRVLAEAIPQIVWTASADGWFDYYNQRWFEYTGLTLEETQGWGWQLALHPDDVENCVESWKTSVRRGGLTRWNTALNGHLTGLTAGIWAGHCPCGTLRGKFSMVRDLYRY